MDKVRKCTTCERDKPMSAFSVRHNGTFLRSCKLCKSESVKRWRAKNARRKYIAVPSKARCPACRRSKPAASFYPDRQRKNGLGPYCKLCVSAIRKRCYGLSPDDYRALLVKQADRCAICKLKESAKGMTLAVDHDHVSSLVRGLLCSNCNNGLGRFKENPQTLMAAARYIERGGS
jgi:hypothetical protein